MHGSLSGFIAFEASQTVQGVEGLTAADYLVHVRPGVERLRGGDVREMTMNAQVPSLSVLVVGSFIFFFQKIIFVLW